MKILSWNIAGIRASLKRGDLDFLKNTDYDIVCLQETKSTEKEANLSEELKQMYPHQVWQSNPGTTQRKGFSGTCIWSKIKPIKIIEPPLFDTEGRISTLEFEKFIILTVYTPNSQDPESPRCEYRIQTWDPSFRNYITELNKIKPLIICGDFNVAYLDIDLYNSKKYYNACAGFLNSERESFNEHLKSGFVDALRIHNQNENLYTYWNQRVPAMRKNNKGWRIDYFLVSQILVETIHGSKIHPDITGSDHCPISLEL